MKPTVLVLAAVSITDVELSDYIGTLRRSVESNAIGSFDGRCAARF
jgi:hypothetical protein